MTTITFDTIYKLQRLQLYRGSLKNRIEKKMVDSRYPAQSLYDYAFHVLKGPFPLGEPAIATNAQYAYAYVFHVLKGPFPLGEPAIARDVQYAYFYAKYILHAPFPMGERTIAESSHLSFEYAHYVLNDSDPETWQKRYLAEHPYILYKPAK